MDWKTLLAYITGENRILRHQVKERRQFSDGERKTLAAIGQKPGKQALEEVATILDCCVLGDGRPPHVAMTVCYLANK